jgi:hypothetical protein
VRDARSLRVGWPTWYASADATSSSPGGDVAELDFGVGDDLVAWRTAMAHAAPFVARLDPSRRDALVARALELLGDHPAPLVRRVLFLAAG